MAQPTKGLYIVNDKKVVIKQMEDKTMKREYMKPTIRVVELQHRNFQLSGSLVGTAASNLDPEDVILIDDDPVGEGFWGR